MPTHVHCLKNFEYNRMHFDLLWVIRDGNGSPPILPLAYSCFLSRYGTVFKSIQQSDRQSRTRLYKLESTDAEDATIRSYIYALSNFLTYLEDSSKTNRELGAHATSSCTEKLVNNYINSVLVDKLDSLSSLQTHHAALSSYFNWLEYMAISPSLELRIYRKTRKEMAIKNNKQHYIQYISKHARLELLKSCKTQGEKLIIRLGYEVGLRTSELTGLTVTGENNLRDLFSKLDKNDFDHINMFEYWLKGKYTKGQKSRWIYFDRHLLYDMKRYDETERKFLTNSNKKEEQSFFVRRDQRYNGTGISASHGSRIFKIRAKEAGLNPMLSFHDLRHTFATELYHRELHNSEGRETRSESAALIVVAQRLGHSFGLDGNAPSVTTRYIRMRLQMQDIEMAA